MSHRRFYDSTILFHSAFRIDLFYPFKTFAYALYRKYLVLLSCNDN